MTCYTALITPFDEAGNLDEAGFAANLARQGDVDGVVVLGTTGEAPTLSDREKARLITLTRNSGLDFIVGCGTYSTQQTLENMHAAAEAGAQAALLIAPYYNKPTQEGLYQHFATLAEKSMLPIILYNHLGRTGTEIAPETIARLSVFKSIIGIKESSNDMTHLLAVMAIKEQHPDFQIYSANDAATLAIMAMGGDGVISVASNLAPAKMQALVTACKSGDFAQARTLQSMLSPLFEACGLETNPIPIKAAMEMAGFAAGNPRLPLTPLHEQHRATVKAAL